MSENSRYTIIGSGVSAWRAACVLVEHGLGNQTTIVTSDSRPPYDRPPLSKAFLTEPEAGAPFFDVQPDFSQSGVTLLLGRPAQSIDHIGKMISIDDGDKIGFEKLLLATGTTPRRLDSPGSENSAVCYLRDLDDATFIRERLRNGANLVVVGGGFIGLEVAASARQIGAKVSVVEGLSRFMARAVPAEIAGRVAERHVSAGVEILYNETIERFDQRQTGTAVVAKSGRVLEADLVVVGVGVEPATQLAGSADLELNDGVCVDAYCLTSHPDIFAAGDCANFPLHMADGARIRLQSWRHAHDHGAVAALNMIGKQTPYQGIPWFWSDQYDLGLQVTGIIPDEAVFARRELPNGALVLFHFDRSRRLAGASGIGVGNAIAKDIKVAEKLIERRISPAPEALADPSISLKGLLKAG